MYHGHVPDPCLAQDLQVRGLEVQKPLSLAPAHAPGSKGPQEHRAALLLDGVAAAADPGPQGDCQVGGPASVLPQHLQGRRQDPGASPPRVQNAEGPGGPVRQEDRNAVTDGHASDRLRLPGQQPVGFPVHVPRLAVDPQHGTGMHLPAVHQPVFADPKPPEKPPPAFCATLGPVTVLAEGVPLRVAEIPRGPQAQCRLQAPERRTASYGKAGRQAVRRRQR